MELLSITDEGSAPFVNYADFQDFLDALTVEAFDLWNDALSKDEADHRAVRACIVLYLKEIGQTEMENDETLLHEIYSRFSIGVAIAHNVKIGHVIQKGRLSLVNDRATFTLSHEGIEHVEKNLLKKKP